ncbi:class B sortase [Metasolibacillus meyeri]|uniref:class B sortase n=1 Tax=Metasolibacillus meyeri TaxID=1071052 RepID=UPI00187D18FD|nr:class B sortase [Metasolibacillus meyeri]
MKGKVIQTICIIVFIVSTIGLVRYFYSYKQVEQELRQVQEVYEEASSEEVEVDTKFIELQKINSDIVGWLRLEGSQLDNPILQTDNNDFYLSHNYAGEKSRAGSVFMDYRNGVDARHTILYGHVMRNGTMFGELAKFAEQQYAEAHSYFIYETPKVSYRLEVFAAYETTIDFYYIETEFTDASYAEFLQTIQQKSLIAMPVTVTTNDKIMTLSTCTTSPNDHERFVVHAKIVVEK